MSIIITEYYCSKCHNKIINGMCSVCKTIYKKYKEKTTIKELKKQLQKCKDIMTDEQLIKAGF